MPAFSLGTFSTVRILQAIQKGLGGHAEAATGLCGSSPSLWSPRHTTPPVRGSHEEVCSKELTWVAQTSHCCKIARRLVCLVGPIICTLKPVIGRGTTRA